MGNALEVLLHFWVKDMLGVVSEGHGRLWAPALALCHSPHASVSHLEAGWLLVLSDSGQMG